MLSSASLLGILRNGDLNEFWLNWGDADVKNTWPTWMAPVCLALICTWAAHWLAQMRVLPSRRMATYAWEKKHMHSNAWSQKSDVMPQHWMPHRMWAQRSTIIAVKDTKVQCAWSVRQTILQLEKVVRNAPKQRHIQLHCPLWQGSLWLLQLSVWAFGFGCAVLPKQKYSSRNSWRRSCQSFSSCVTRWKQLRCPGMRSKKDLISG